ncbi:DUF4832 domain-containing protein [Actinopolymorpha alba]|uniref:DUF4832 domain-containing protein n=1 Tax=Actinopolymorpha alba TaxID=533267 RepID=UPI0003797ACD|nr:DUF4832 domain-containing protein [Actinopolymorpha alba]
MRRLVVFAALVPALVFAGAAGTSASAPPSTSPARTTADGAVRTYAPSDEVLANPQRGFYHHTETHYRPDGSGYAPLDAATLRTWREQDKVTQVLRVFYLEKFATTDRIDSRYLDLMRADFASARAAGVKLILRFAYAQPRDDWPYQPPYGDAPKSRVLKHIAQLAPVLRGNADVIEVVQAGFIGLWGEGYYTDHFVADPSDPGTVTEQDWANRREVYLALLKALPADRMIQVRTMQMKQKALGRPSGVEGALTAEEAFTGGPAARIGHHNDCFLASPDDFGTFLSDPITLDQEYLAQETRFVPAGGETCNVNPPRSEWPSAAAELARYHYSYLNADYNRAVLNSWGEGLVEAKRRLGYRFRLTQGSFTDGVRPGRSFTVNLALRNDGWAAPFSRRGVELVLQGERRSYAFSVKADPRRWEAGTTANLSVRACAALPPGRYQLLLNLPDPAPSLRSQAPLPGTQTSYNAAYAIQLANQGVWQPRTGYNDLRHTLVVDAKQPQTGSCEGAVQPRVP